MKRSRTRGLLPPAAMLALLLPLWLVSPDIAQAGDKPCSQGTLNGSYGFYRTGNTSAGPLAAVGIITFDGNGSTSGSQSISRNGAFTFDVQGASNYEVNADCTGRMIVSGVETARLVVSDQGNSIYMLSETAGNAVYVVATKIGK